VKRWKRLALALAAVALGSEARAQCAIVPGTGCGLPPLKDCMTNPSVGTVFCMSSLPCPAPCGPIQINVWYFGPPMLIPLPLPTCCSPAPCVLYSPMIDHTQLRPPGPECYPIPAIPGLVGVTIGIQPACFLPTPLCIDLAPALMITIRP
jgi:hypothetical protein